MGASGSVRWVKIRASPANLIAVGVARDQMLVCRRYKKWC